MANSEESLGRLVSREGGCIRWRGGFGKLSGDGAEFGPPKHMFWMEIERWSEMGFERKIQELIGLRMKAVDEE